MGGIILRLSLILLVMLSAPGAAQAQVFTKPCNLAVVVAGSPSMEKPWPSRTMREALQRALTMELRTLPLRATAGVWLADEKSRQLIPPAPSASLKRAEVEIPAQTKPADPHAALREALAWLTEQGSGSLIFLAPEGAGGLDLVWPDTGDKEIFCHTLGLGARAPAKPLAALALAGGGEYMEAKEPERLAFTLRRAFRVALSPARLEILAHDPDNRPVELILEIQRRKRREPAQAARSNRQIQLLPGVYEVHYPSANGAGPGPLPELVSVDRKGLTRLWAGGQGKLTVRAQDAEGEDLAWYIKVTAQRDGRIVVPERKTPFEADLPAGYYIATVRHPRLDWTIEVRPDSKVDLVAGPKAQLRLTLKGPAGPVRLPYEAYSLLEGRRVATGYTNALLRLLPGPYRLELESAPPLVQKIDLSPGENKALELPGLGALLVADTGPRGPDHYQVSDLTGHIIAQGRPGRSLLLLPGIYLVRNLDGEAGDKVRILSGKVWRSGPPPEAR